MDNEIGRFVYNGKVIRDAIHGDIFVPEKFLAVVDTPEFHQES